jgi:hypothetical protein
MKIYNKVLLFALVVFFSSCGKDKQLSNIPELEFTSFTNFKDASGRDTSVYFRFAFKDGDGDIGTSNEALDTTCGADNNNLFIAYEEKRADGKYYPKKLWQQVTLVDSNCDTTVFFDSVQVQFNQRMQYLEPEGNGKSIEGDVNYKMDYVSAVVLLSTEGRFVFYIEDRMKNKSNIISTPDLVIVK